MPSTIANPIVIDSLDILLRSQLHFAMVALDSVIPTFRDRVCTYTANIQRRVPKNGRATCPLNDIKSLSGRSLGMLSAYINIDASTKILHTERDLTYTWISVPKQDNVHEMGINFQFCLTRDLSLFLKMSPLTSFAYSGHFVTHRQNHDGGKDFINISSYGNQRLFFNARKSISRLSK